MTRLPEPFGHRINRKRTIRFSFEGRTFEGYEGDTIASALAAAGQWVLSRSFKYHRPRGVMSMAGAEASTLVQLPSEPNVLAELEPICDGLSVTAQNIIGSLDHDRAAIMEYIGRFLPVGFYYRTFIGPTRGSWLKLWEPLIRKMAGLGVVDTRAARRHFEKSHLHCDILVVGAGPAGLAAAISAAEAGADVVLCDENPEIGGTLTYKKDNPGALAPLRARFGALPNLQLMQGTVCNGWFEDNWLSLIQGNWLFRTRARQVILATGAIEQPAVFRNNDLPGIMLGGAVQRLIRHYGVQPGRCAVVLAGNRDGYRVALDLIEAGVSIAALVDPRSGGSGGDLAAVVVGKGVEILSGATIEEAQGTAGNRHVAFVRVGARCIACDLVAVSVGYAPAWQLPCQAGAQLGYDDSSRRFVLDVRNQALLLAGAVNGKIGLETVMADGRHAASKALARLGYPVTEDESTPFDHEAALVNCDLPITAHPKGRDFVDFDEDLQVSDIQNSVKEGYCELELVKRFSTVGMGPSQGRHSAFATARILAEATNRRVGDIGVTTTRPPTGPECLGVLAGDHLTIERRTALHSNHLALHAVMKPVGTWRRPYFYGAAAHSERLVREEVGAVREGVGILDVSTLGKLEIRGPDSGEFLDRLYTMAHANQAVGRVRYCLMLNEMGSVIDDGVAYRMAEDCYYVTATTGAISRVYTDMLFWNAQWRLNVDVLNLTGAFCGLNITGPLARAVLQGLDSDIDFGRGTFAYLDGRQGLLTGVPVRAMRIGFTGELSFELHCPASFAPTLWNNLIAAGKPHGLRPYGLEASRMLRLEKGHILIGQDTDALTTPSELGFNWAISRRKPFFVGKRSIELRARFGEARRLVGLRFPADQADIPSEGCLVLRNSSYGGHVTSAGFSPTLGHCVALAYVHIEDAQAGKTVVVKCRSGQHIEATVSAHAFYDPENARQEL